MSQYFREGERSATPSPFYTIKVKTRTGVWKKRGTGTADETVARDMAEMATTCAAKHAWDLIDRILADGPAAVFAHWVSTPGRKHQRTGAMMAPSDDERLQYTRDQFNVVDLRPVVEEWRDKFHANAKYVIQVSELIPAGAVYPLTSYTLPKLAEHINGLAVAPRTMRRYRTAHSAFQAHLQQRGLLGEYEHFANLVKLPKIEAEEVPFLEMDEARAVCDQLSGEQRAMEAFMASTSAELGACANLRRRAIDFERRMVKLHVPEGGKYKGRKTKFRSRTVEVTEDWAWAIFAAWAHPMMPDTPVFPGVRTPALQMRALRSHKAACRGLGLPETTFHAYRHTFAATWIDRGVLGARDGERDLNWLRDRLGHSRNSILVLTTYAVRIADRSLRLQKDATTKDAPRETAAPHLKAVR